MYWINLKREISFSKLFKLLHENRNYYKLLSAEFDVNASELKEKKKIKLLSLWLSLESLWIWMRLIKKLELIKTMRKASWKKMSAVPDKLDSFLHSQLQNKQTTQSFALRSSFTEIILSCEDWPILYENFVLTINP